MVRASVLAQAGGDMIPQTAEALHELNGLAEVYSVAGRYDLVGVIRVRTNEELAALVTAHILKLRGIERTET